MGMNAFCLDTVLFVWAIKDIRCCFIGTLLKEKRNNFHHDALFNLIELCLKFLNHLFQFTNITQIMVQKFLLLYLPTLLALFALLVHFYIFTLNSLERSGEGYIHVNAGYKKTSGGLTGISDPGLP